MQTDGQSFVYGGKEIPPPPRKKPNFFGIAVSLYLKLMTRAFRKMVVSYKNFRKLGAKST